MTIAKELMTEAPATILETERVRDAVELMRAFDVRHVLVVGERGTLVGMVSDRDVRAVCVPCIVEDAAAGTVQRALDARVVDVMSSDVLSANPDDDVRDLIDLMVESRVGAVPIVDDDERLVGIVSYVDILRWAAAYEDTADAAE